MKSVLISIQPKWCDKISNREKTIEVRKSAPKCEVPFKCYIYCTNTPKYHHLYDLREFSNGDFVYSCVQHNKYSLVASGYANGKVIGEFVCDKIERFRCASVPYKKENNLGYGRFVDNGVYKVDGWCEGIVFERNDRYIDTMLNNNDLKEMCLSAQAIFDYIGIGKCFYAWYISDLKIYDKPRELKEFGLNRAPQSWCYVEVENGKDKS